MTARAATALFLLLFFGSASLALASTTTTVARVAGIEVISSNVTVRDARHSRHTYPRRSHVIPLTVQTLDVREVRNRQPAISPLAERLVRTALSLIGTRYRWGGATRNGFDCSGFTTYVYRRLGIAIPRTADTQFAAGLPVREPSPGDLVFFQTYAWGASHVGIYLGGWRFVNAIGKSVHVTTFASEYFRSRYLGARRFLPS